MFALLVTAFLQYLVDGIIPSAYCLAALPIVIISIAIYQKYPVIHSVPATGPLVYSRKKKYKQGQIGKKSKSTIAEQSTRVQGQEGHSTKADRVG